MSRPSQWIESLRILGTEAMWSLRSLVRHKGFSLIAIFTLALGIGANTAIFSVLNAVVLQPLPYEDSEELVFVWGTDTISGERGPVMPSELYYWREQAEVFDSLAAYMFWAFNLTGQDDPEAVVAAAVTPNLFPLLKVEAEVGRTFTEEEGVLGQTGNVVLLGQGLWRRRFGESRDVVGQKISLDGEDHEVIGILPAGFDFPHGDVDLWVPMAFNPFGAGFRRASVSVLGRLADDVELGPANQAMRLVSQRLAEEFPATNQNRGAELASMHEQMVGGVRPVLLSLLAAVGAVLLIACVNVGSLFLARALEQQNEVALRKALGAGWLGLVRRPMLEGLILSLAGGACGLLLASWGLRFLTVASPAEVPRLEQATLDLDVLGFTLLVSLVAGLVFTLLPALRLLRSEPRQLINEGNKEGPGRHHTHRALIVAEVALALFLLVASGSILRNLGNLKDLAWGFENEDRLVAQIVLPDAKYPGDQPWRFFDQLRQGLEGLPGVESVGASTALPMNTGTADFEVPFEIQGRPRAADEAEIVAQLQVISAGYLETMGIGLAAGRGFQPTDRPDTQRVVLINETMADRFWSGENPVGARIDIDFLASRGLEVVGVVRDVRRYGGAAESAPEIYMPLAQNPARGLMVVMATSTDPMGFREALKNELWAIDPEQPLTMVTTMEDLLSESLAGKRFHSLLMSVFAALALILAAVGIHGVMSQVVSHRTREIGLRMALGARAGDVVGSVVGRALRWTAMGMACGGALAFFVLTTFDRFVSRFLESISVADLSVFFGAAAILGIVAVAGSYLPARRASRVDPMIALRCD